MPRTVKNKTASKTDKIYRKIKDELDSVLSEYKEASGRRISSWLFDVDKRRRRIMTSVSIFEFDRQKVIETVNDIVKLLKSRGFNIDPWPLEPPNYNHWQFKFAVKVKVPTARKKKRSVEPPF